ncbi:MAG: hypothetical protein WCJ03_04545 [Bacteroidales bacterium]
MKYKINNISTSNLFKIGVVIILILWLFYTVINNTVLNYRLLNSGLRIGAVVYERKDVGSKGTVLIKYYFLWKGKKYYGESTSDDSLKKDDSLTVFFLENDPNINKSHSVVE